MLLFFTNILYFLIFYVAYRITKVLILCGEGALLFYRQYIVIFYVKMLLKNDYMLYNDY